MQRLRIWWPARADTVPAYIGRCDLGVSLGITYVQVGFPAEPRMEKRR